MYKRHQQTHLQTHIDSWSKTDKVSWKSPDGMTQDLFKIFEKYRLGERAVSRERSRVLELQHRLKELVAGVMMKRSQRRV